VGRHNLLEEALDLFGGAAEVKVAAVEARNFGQFIDIEQHERVVLQGQQLPPAQVFSTRLMCTEVSPSVSASSVCVSDSAFVSPSPWPIAFCRQTS
jgi:hypothetical protein